MRYLSGKDVELLGLDWNELIGVIKDACRALAEHKYSQPVKLYLRYGDPMNRIIAMPAYNGSIGNPMSGIKWIASFPGNVNKGVARAHSVTILNDPETGIPVGIINAAQASILRTAAVSATLLMQYARSFRKESLIVGIVGFGPIGQAHVDMVKALLGSRVKTIRVFDVRHEEAFRNFSGVEFCQRWEDAYTEADVFITATVSSRGYINLPPKKGSLQLNVSLRDYLPSIMEHIDLMVVDDWQEVCREGTDIERMHLERGLKQEDTVRFDQVVLNDVIARDHSTSTIMFNPMGMAVFDIAVGGHILRQSEQKHIGLQLPAGQS